jgi:short-subunit dehydrogenase
MIEGKAGQVVVITGGSSGIGRSTALLFARRGWRVGLIARGRVGLEEVRAQIAGLGATVAIAEADVSDAAALAEAGAALSDALGPPDVWINNAGVGVFARFTEMPVEEFDRVTAVNYLGVVNGTRVALSFMRPRNKGRIVNVSSAIGLRGVSLQSAYAGAKWAMRGFAEAVRAELTHERSRVSVVTVYPPSVNTPFYNHAITRIDGLPRPPPPIYQPEPVAQGIFFAATSRRRDVLIGEQTVAVALANRVAPALADRLVGLLSARSQTSSNSGLKQRDENVFEPSRTVGAEHGVFNVESLPASLQVRAMLHPGRVAAGLGLAALAISAALRNR